MIKFTARLLATTKTLWLLLLCVILAPAANALDPFTNHWSLHVNASGAGFVSIGGTLGYTGMASYTVNSIAEGTGITLIAPSSASGNIFSGWSGCDSVSGTSCYLTMSFSKFVTAYYSTPSYSLSVNTTGAAFVPISGGNYGGTSNYSKFSISSGTSITLTAPGSSGGAAFVGWNGCDQVFGFNCVVNMFYSRGVSAAYAANGYSLNVTTGGASAVSITGTGGYGGVSNYSQNGIAAGTSITLTAPAAVGTANFTGWTGCDSVVNNDCSVTMNSSKSVQANYATPVYGLSVVASGASAVVISNSNGYGGTTNYTRSVAVGTVVTLAAPASQGTANFSSWTGCDSTAALTCTVTTNGSKSVTVNYVTPVYSLSVIASGASSVPISNSNGYGGTTNYTVVGIAAGTSITLSAPATMGAANFTSWSGCDTANSTTCTVTMSSSKFVTASYSTVSYNLNVISTGATAVTVTNGNGYGGVTDYTKSAIAPNTVITLQLPTVVGSSATYTLYGLSGCNSYNLSTGTCTVTMDSSKFVVAQYGPTVYALGVSVSGASAVVIGGSGNYGGVANYTVAGIAANTIVALTAPATAGTANFSSWSGCDSVAGTVCSVTMNSGKAVVANYATPSYALNVSASGVSSVVITSTGNYGGTANYSVTGIASGTSIALTAPVTAGTTNFTSWSGCDSVASNVCTVVMSSAKFVIANYTTPVYTLAVNSSGASAVAITSSSLGSGNYGGVTNYSITAIASGTTVTLIAPSSSGTATFSSWSGCDTTVSVSCTVAMSSSKFVTANYVSKDTYRLSVNSSGASAVAITGTGTGTSSFGGTTNYAVASIVSGSVITLQAPATAGLKAFNSWTGCDTTSNANRTCTVTMSANKTVTVSYSFSKDFLARIASDRVLKAVATTNSTTSTARFTVGASSDGGKTFSDTFTTKDVVTIAGAVYPQEQDVGKAMDVFIVLMTTRDGVTTWAYKTSDSFKAWSGKIEELEPAYQESSSVSGDAYLIYEGSVAAGTQQIFMGYRAVSQSAGAAGAAGASNTAPLQYTTSGMVIKISP